MVSTVLYVVSETHTETVLQQMVGVGRWAGSNVAAYVFARAIKELSRAGRGPGSDLCLLIVMFGLAVGYGLAVLALESPVSATKRSSATAFLPSFRSGPFPRVVRLPRGGQVYRSRDCDSCSAVSAAMLRVVPRQR